MTRLATLPTSLGHHLTSYSPASAFLALCAPEPQVVHVKSDDASAGVPLRPADPALGYGGPLAFDLLASLTPEQKKTAIIAAEDPGEVRSPGTPQPPTDAPAGIAAGDLNDEQRKILISLLDAYCDNFPVDVAKERKIGYWAEQIAIQADVVRGLASCAANKREECVATLRTTADREDATLMVLPLGVIARHSGCITSICRPSAM